MKGLNIEMQIREFTTEDYDAYAAIHNAVYPDYKLSASDLRHYDERKEAKIKWKRWLAEVDGTTVAFGAYSNSPWSYHPRKFWLELGVHPDYRRRGIGAAFYDRILEAVMDLDPIVLRTGVREDEDGDRRFVQARGFTDRMRTEESRLDITAFDPAHFQDDLKRVEEQGIVIKSYLELAADPERDRKLHDVDIEVAKDVPSLDPITPLEFDAWHRLFIDNPRFLPECYMIALDGDRYIGLSNLWKEETAGRVETGLTGVRRAYRKRGVATALKVRALAAAKELGYEGTLTWNEEKNKGMLGINLRLGFKPFPAWIHVEKVFNAGTMADTQEAKGKK